MAQIRIKTPQNVMISYELANAVQRFIAFLLDLVFYILLWWVLEIALEVSSIFSGRLNEWVGFFVAIVAMGYTLIQEFAMSGQTFGKKIIGIKVVKLDGTKPSFSDFFLRWIFRVVDIFLSFFSSALFTHTITENKQRLGDLLAGTTVVSIKFDESRLSLKKIKNQNSLEKYVQKFEHIKNFSEEEMVLVKNCLFRKLKYKNKAHQEIFNAMVKKIAVRLELQRIPKDKDRFIKEVIKDYVLANR